MNSASSRAGVQAWSVSTLTEWTPRRHGPLGTNIVLFFLSSAFFTDRHRSVVQYTADSLCTHVRIETGFESRHVNSEISRNACRHICHLVLTQKVSDVDGVLVHCMTINANCTNMKERIWIIRVAVEIELLLLYADIDMP